MLKKYLLVLPISILTACAGYYPYPQFEPSYPSSSVQHNDDEEHAVFSIRRTHEPKYQDPRYKISMEDMEKFILAKNNLEYCLLPELGKQSDKRVTALEKRLLKDMINDELSKIVGKASARTIFDDQFSYDYFQFKYQQLNHDVNNIREFECRDLKRYFRDRLNERKRKQGLAGDSRSVENQVQKQRQTIDDAFRRFHRQRESIERQIRGESEPLYKSNKNINVDWTDPYSLAW
ncbi:DUF5358 family protein [Aggregatibacter actinomycetemcomitans]|uniref:DUF5358 family protein n=1 Tax=Aggregatibacter actinomycetemcomitans TaxID=714 RepID=UPI0011DA115F|nr:DUF5358 family protein [Aggregatibacter actinomycetemcomitans]QEH47056.1 hypothetical protein FXN59_05025 [Aggregatibacter actinomycetemcomitans]TYA49865.1 hypothetical protein FXB74_01645 [Aggregatibacter actinomycetemcomitans]